MNCTPRRPRATRLSRKTRQWTSASDSATETPRMRRPPSGSTPMAESTAASRTTHPAVPELLVAGIQQQIARLAERARAPGLQLGIEQRGSAADLGGGEQLGIEQRGSAAELGGGE